MNIRGALFFVLLLNLLELNTYLLQCKNGFSHFFPFLYTVVKSEHSGGAATVEKMGFTNSDFYKVVAKWAPLMDMSKATAQE